MSFLYIHLPFIGLHEFSRTWMGIECVRHVTQTDAINTKQLSVEGTS